MPLRKLKHLLGKIYIYKELMDDLDFEVLMTGDYNAVLNSQQDRSRNSSTPVLSIHFLRYAKELGYLEEN